MMLAIRVPQNWWRKPIPARAGHVFKQIALSRGDGGVKVSSPPHGRRG
jgi:hypothetical protein